MPSLASLYIKSAGIKTRLELASNLTSVCNEYFLNWAFCTHQLILSKHQTPNDRKSGLPTVFETKPDHSIFMSSVLEARSDH